VGNLRDGDRGPSGRPATSSGAQTRAALAPRQERGGQDSYPCWIVSWIVPGQRIGEKSKPAPLEPKGAAPSLRFDAAQPMARPARVIIRHSPITKRLRHYEAPSMISVLRISSEPGRVWPAFSVETWDMTMVLYFVPSTT
jgi:hypothetical protein